MLVFVIGVGLYEDRDKLFGASDSVPTNVTQQSDQDIQTDGESEGESDDLSTEEDEQTAVDTIPMDVIPGTETQE